MKRFENKTALITGASRGIGAAVAKALAAEGAHVILVARSVGGLEEVDDEIQNMGGQATLVPLDLTELNAIDSLAAPLYDRWKKLDILVGAAATLGKLTPVPQYDPKLWEDVFKLNFHANWRLLRALDPLLRNAEQGRALFVTSSEANLGKQFWAGYASSKAALQEMIRTYAAETAKTNLKVNLIDPGPTATKLRLSAYPGEDQSNLPSADEQTDKFLNALSEGFTKSGDIIR